MSTVAGYDIGGAHLKVARVENGRVTAVDQTACPLWEGLDQLGTALDATRDLVRDADVHAITMTGELCELFTSRRDGVEKIIAYVSGRTSGPLHVFMGLKGFGDPTAASSDPETTGSANFLATVVLLARTRTQALLIDMGSTTTDIIACDRPQGLTDAERLQTGELVYTGLTRTSVPCVTTRGVLLGQWQALQRDHFATMADVRRVLGHLEDGLDLHGTADGRGKSQAESVARLARGFGRDGEMRHLTGWQAAAAAIREAQLSSIVEAAAQVCSRPKSGITSVITAGVGTDEAAEVARRLKLPSAPFGAILGLDGELQRLATHAAPAVAVALLLAAQSDRDN